VEQNYVISDKSSGICDDKFSGSSSNLSSSPYEVDVLPISVFLI
jgi:hypothetical protein